MLDTVLSSRRRLVLLHVLLCAIWKVTSLSKPKCAAQQSTKSIWTAALPNNLVSWLSSFTSEAKFNYQFKSCLIVDKLEATRIKMKNQP